jgi:hypothetical protein
MRSVLVLFIIAAMAFPLCARDIKTLDGKVYKNVEISSVTPVGFDISYTKENGTFVIKELFFKNLPDDIKKEFKYDQAKAESFQKKVTDIQQKRTAKLAAERKRELQEIAETDSAVEHYRSIVYSHRMYAVLKSVRPYKKGTLVWVSSTDQAVTDESYKVYIAGIELPQNTEWEGYIYPIGKDMEGYEAYCTSLDMATALKMKKNNAF